MRHWDCVSLCLCGVVAHKMTVGRLINESGLTFLVTEAGGSRWLFMLVLVLVMAKKVGSRGCEGKRQITV